MEVELLCSDGQLHPGEPADEGRVGGTQLHAGQFGTDTPVNPVPEREMR
jgi:hypothetical protein